MIPWRPLRCAAHGRQVGDVYGFDLPLQHLGITEVSATEPARLHDKLAARLEADA